MTPCSDNAEALTSPSLSEKFATYRRLVPLVSDDGVTYLTASLAPPSNLIVHDALTRYGHDALHNPAPKPAWQQGAADLRSLIAQYINAGDPENMALLRDTTEGLASFARGI